MRGKRGGGNRAQSSRLSPAAKGSRPYHSLRYLFFGGKGGVGKTTAACAAALHLLESTAHDERILLFSTDPAHSLSDSLEVRIGDRLQEVARVAGACLVAYEMDAGPALERFRAKHRAILSEIAARGTLLDEADINELLNLSLPGLDEVMALFELSELDRAATYKHIVIDTAPSGHTSRLLQLPGIFSQMVTALDRLADKHRYILAHFARGRHTREDEVDIFLRDMTKRIETVRAMLFDRRHTSFVLVVTPEALSVKETERYLTVLQQEGVPVTDLIINRVEHEHDGCAYCHARILSQKPWLKELARAFGGLRPHSVPLLPQEVRGLDTLRLFARLVWVPSTAKAFRPTRTHKKEYPAGLVDSARGSIQYGKSNFKFEPRRMVIFGGKGGVGKTTAATAYALALAKQEKIETLVFSTDPAHSLSDSFDQRIGQIKHGVGGTRKLDAMEIDPSRRFEELKQRYRSWIDSLFGSLGGGSRLEIKFDREAMRQLVELTPPGIDEIAALSAVSDLSEQNRYGTIVLDTAPTGHLVRFLELPEVALSWVRTFIKLVLKYQNVVQAGQVAEELIALSKSIKRVIALLTDAGGCEFVGVAIPERMSLEETVRLERALRRLKIPMRRLLINGLIPADAAAQCEFCRARRRVQLATVRQFRRRFAAALEIFVAPQQPHEIHGPERLLHHFAQWRSSSGETRSAKNELTSTNAKSRVTERLRKAKKK